VSEEKVVSVTGHRPPAYGGYGYDVFEKLVDVAKEGLFMVQPFRVITGMALGWDMAVAWACVETRVAFDAYIPFHEQGQRWTQEWWQHYANLLGHARRIVVARSEHPDLDVRRLYLKRDEMMIDASSETMAMYDGRQKGGTYHTVKYAKRMGRVVTNMWPMWVKKYGASA